MDSSAVRPLKSPSFPRVIRRAIARFLWSRPRLYRFIGLLKGRGDVLDTNYDIAVDGYPRSGNTFAAQMIMVTQEDKLKVKVHLHLPTVLINATRIHKPVCLVIRRPIDAVASQLIYSGGKIRSELEQYIDFYTVLLPFRSRLLVLPFDAITRDFKIDLALINQRFGLELKIPIDLSPCQQEAFVRIDNMWRDPSGKVDKLRMGRPHPNREALKKVKKEELQDPQYAALLQECDRLYAVFYGSFQQEMDQLEKTKPAVK